VHSLKSPLINLKVLFGSTFAMIRCWEMAVDVEIRKKTSEGFRRVNLQNEG